MKREIVLAAFTMGVLAVTSSSAHAQSVRVPGFLPSEHGFQFFNSWPTAPDIVLNVAGVNVPIGDAANGLCGGMAFAVRDYYEAGYHVPLSPSNPAPNTPLFDFIAQRLLNSLSPNMVARLYGLQASPLDWVRQNTMYGEWPLIKAELDAGRLTPLVLVRRHGDFNPFNLGENHQVLAFGYDVLPGGVAVAIHLYDPNHPGDDAVTLTYDTASLTISESTGEPIYSFFRDDYVWVAPPPTQTWSTSFEGTDPRWWWVTGVGDVVEKPGAAHSGSGVARVEARTDWNAVNEWVPMVPGRACTVKAWIWTISQYPFDGFMTMRSAASDYYILGTHHLDDRGAGHYHAWTLDFIADDWWGKFSVGLWGTGSNTWLFFDDVTVVCEDW